MTVFSPRHRVARHYRIDFALTVLTGNRTRYMITRHFVDRTEQITARWFIFRTWFDGDVLRILPNALRVRLRDLFDSIPLFIRTPADAIVFHAFFQYYLYVLL